MARIVPSDIARLELSGANPRELETLRLLQSRLPDSYLVFHGVHWTRELPRDALFGELDFVVVNQAGRTLLIEQKDVDLEETEDGLVAHYADGTKSVTRQVHRALDHVREKFRRSPGHPATIDLDYLIYCPRHHLKHINAAGLDASRIVDANERDRLPGRIEALLGVGEPGQPAWVSRVTDFFRQVFIVVPDIHAHVTAHERHFTRLSGTLVRLIEGLDMDPFRLRVLGTAGCGKTLIACHYFDRALARGRRPLLVCFNRPLAERLKVALQPRGGLVTTWYGLIRRFLEDNGVPLDFSQMGTDPAFWDKAAERMVDLPLPEPWMFDTLIVDEGQDFHPEWLEHLRLLLRHSSEIVWLEDPDQNLRHQPRAPLSGFVTYRTHANYRSPQTIALYIQHTLPFEFDVMNDLPGLGVGVTPYDHASEQPAIVARLVDDLRRRGFAYGQIVLLTTKHLVTPGADRSVFQDLQRVGSHRLRRFTGEYDLLGNQLTTAGQITFDSVGRFKGQEAPAVILVDVDPSVEADDHTLFSGMTRATLRLDLLVRRDNPLNARFLRHAHSRPVAR